MTRIQTYSATARIDGQAVSELSHKALRDLRSRRIGMVFQHFGLSPHRTALANVALPLELRGEPESVRQAAAFTQLQAVGLDGLGRALPARVVRWDATACRPGPGLGDQPYLGEQGFYIPGYLQDKYGVKSIYDLNKPEVAKLFEPLGGGKPELLVGPAAWESTYIGQIKAKDYGFADKFESVSTGASVTYAKQAAAYKAQRSVVFHAYTPDWIFSAFDLRRLEEPAFDGYAQDNKKDDPLYKADGCWKFISPTVDPDWLSKSRVTCTFPDAKVYVLPSTALQKRAPKIAEFLHKFAIEPAQLNGLVQKIEKRRVPADIAAKAWVQSNGATVEQWLATPAPTWSAAQ